MQKIDNTKHQAMTAVHADQVKDNIEALLIEKKRFGIEYAKEVMNCAIEHIDFVCESDNIPFRGEIIIPRSTDSLWDDFSAIGDIQEDADCTKLYEAMEKYPNPMAILIGNLRNRSVQEGIPPAYAKNETLSVATKWYYPNVRTELARMMDENGYECLEWVTTDDGDRFLVFHSPAITKLLIENDILVSS